MSPTGGVTAALGDRLDADPAVLTLAEALRDADAGAADVPPTLVWGGGPGVAALAAELATRGPVQLVTDDARTLAAGRRGGLDVHAALLPAPPSDDAAAQAPRRVVLRMARAKAALESALAWVMATQPEGTAVWLTGHTRDGVKALQKRLSKRYGFEPAQAAHTKRHARALITRVPADRPAEAPDAPTRESLEARFAVPLPGADGESFEAVSYVGTFAHGRLDDGSALLLTSLGPHLRGRRALDLGCGAGVLGTAAALARSAIRVDLVDLSFAACEGARATLAAAGVEPERARVHHAEVEDLARLAPGPVDLVVANAPFHDGREEDRDLGARFARAARAQLVPGAPYLVVANSHLGMAPVLEGVFGAGRVDVVAQTGRFKVWRARR